MFDFSAQEHPEAPFASRKKYSRKVARNCRSVKQLFLENCAIPRPRIGGVKACFRPRTSKSLIADRARDIKRPAVFPSLIRA